MASQKAHQDVPVRAVQVPPSGEGEVVGFLLRAFSFILRNSSVEGREIQLQGFSRQAVTEAYLPGPLGGPGTRGSELSSLGPFRILQVPSAHSRATVGACPAPFSGRPGLSKLTVECLWALLVKEKCNQSKEVTGDFLA